MIGINALKAALTPVTIGAGIPTAPAAAIAIGVTMLIMEASGAIGLLITFVATRPRLPNSSASVALRLVQPGDGAAGAATGDSTGGATGAATGGTVGAAG